MPVRMVHKRLKPFEVSERKQVGDTESMITQERNRLSQDDSGREL